MKETIVLIFILYTVISSGQRLVMSSTSYADKLYPKDTIEANKLLDSLLRADFLNHITPVDDAAGIFVPYGRIGTVGMRIVETFKYISDLDNRKTVIIIASSYNSSFDGISVAQYNSYTTVIRTVQYDYSLAEQLVYLHPDIYSYSHEAHSKNIAIETILLLISKFYPNMSVMTVVVGTKDIYKHELLLQDLDFITNINDHFLIFPMLLSQANSKNTVVDADTDLNEFIAKNDITSFRSNWIRGKFPNVRDLSVIHICMLYCRYYDFSLSLSTYDCATPAKGSKYYFGYLSETIPIETKTFLLTLALETLKSNLAGSTSAPSLSNMMSKIRFYKEVKIQNYACVTFVLDSSIMHRCNFGENHLSDLFATVYDLSLFITKNMCREYTIVDFARFHVFITIYSSLVPPYQRPSVFFTTDPETQTKVLTVNNSLHRTLLSFDPGSYSHACLMSSVYQSKQLFEEIDPDHRSKQSAIEALQRLCIRNKLDPECWSNNQIVFFMASCDSLGASI
ncbi:hypothetical protein WA158_003966 [Blastocystis sp. Blastoise]